MIDLNITGVIVNGRKLPYDIDVTSLTERYVTFRCRENVWGKCKITFIAYGWSKMMKLECTTVARGKAVIDRYPEDYKKYLKAVKEMREDGLI